MSLPKISIVGAGQVGATVAHLTLLAGLGDVTLIDVVDGLAQGKALDLLQAAAVEDRAVSIQGTTDFGALVDSRIVVITAGLARKPGMSRDDLLAANAGIVGPIADQIARLAKPAIVIVVTNPLDVMTHLVLKRTGFPRERVMGMAGVLDSGRLKAFLAQEAKVEPAKIHALVLGSHGDMMVPIAGSVTIDGRPASERLDPSVLNRIFERTRNGGAEIVALLKQSSAYYAPGSAVAQMIRAILTNERRALPVSVLLQGEYGLQDVCIGVPAELGASGIGRIVDVPLTADERQALHRAAEQVRQGITTLMAAKVA